MVINAQFPIHSIKEINHSPWKISNRSVEIRHSPRRNETILRNFEIFPPKFHFILPKFYFLVPWRIFIFPLAV